MTNCNGDFHACPYSVSATLVSAFKLAHDIRVEALNSIGFRIDTVKGVVEAFSFKQTRHVFMK